MHVTLGYCTTQVNLGGYSCSNINNKRAIKVTYTFTDARRCQIRTIIEKYASVYEIKAEFQNVGFEDKTKLFIQYLYKICPGLDLLSQQSSSVEFMPLQKYLLTSSNQFYCFNLKILLK